MEVDAYASNRFGDCRCVCYCDYNWNRGKCRIINKNRVDCKNGNPPFVMFFFFLFPPDKIHGTFSLTPVFQFAIHSFLRFLVP